MYPTVGTVHRITTKEYKLPNGPIIPKNVICIVPTLGIHRDSRFYENPLKFDPERFTPEAKINRVGGSYLGFGEGPRHCVGMRFGVLQTKIGLANLLRSFHFDICSKSQIPLQIDTLQLVYTVKGGIYLKTVPTQLRKFSNAQ